MKLLLDQGLPGSAAHLLRKAGIDAIHVGDIGYASAEDSDILQKGREDGRIVVTLDADFHALLALSRAVTPSVIRIRIEGLRGEALAALLQTVLDQCSEELVQGALVTVQQARIRVRRLPLLPNPNNGQERQPSE
jgi:predicted nuclease of predicted toxin-antitoxin system